MDQALARLAAQLKAQSRWAHTSLPAVWLFTDPQRLPNPLAAVGALPRGAGVVFRHGGDGRYRSLASDLVALCRQTGLVCLIGADVDLAEAVGADGLHLPERMLEHAAAIRVRHPAWRLTAAVHNHAAIRAAGMMVDGVFASPIFPSASPSAGAPVGCAVLADWVKAAACPVIALGGVNAQTMDQLVGSGCAGIAGIEMFQN